MTIKPEFFKYLEHFHHTVPVRELVHDSQSPNLIALRHDIDHDLDLALEVAHHEYARGIRATFFLLHTQRYVLDSQFAAKCRQLLAYGHEVGLHLNVLTQWMNEDGDDVDVLLSHAVTPFRTAGIGTMGVSAHGDKACYEHGFINYWIFGDLRGEAPNDTERAKSAEGIVVDDPKWQVAYPGSHALRRRDGSILPLWQSTLSQHGLEYEASHVSHDRYWTDTGGSWSRRGDPMQMDMSRGRHQVLMHPFWWRGEPKIIFALSTARSGSKWLAKFVDRATSCTGLHEWTLNHRREDKEFVIDHRTTIAFQDLVESPTQTSSYIRIGAAHARSLKRDVFEANVYLGVFADALRSANPKATFIHLHRDPRDVVRSLLNRGWYDTPADRRHLSPAVNCWSQMSQLERACASITWLTEQIGVITGERMSFERMVTDLTYVTRRLTELGIIVHPLLAAEEFSRRINASESQEIPRFQEWPDSLKRVLFNICAKRAEGLGYDFNEKTSVGHIQDDCAESEPDRRQLLRKWKLSRAWSAVSPHGLRCRRGMWGFRLKAISMGRSCGHVVLAKGTWKRVDHRDGCPCEPNHYLAGTIRATADGGIIPRVFILFFSESSELQVSHHAASLRLVNAEAEGRQSAQVSFGIAPPLGATHWCLALQIDDWHRATEVVLRSAEVATVRFPVAYRFSDQIAATARRESSSDSSFWR